MLLSFSYKSLIGPNSVARYIKLNTKKKLHLKIKYYVTFKKKSNKICKYSSSNMKWLNWIWFSHII